MKKLVAYLTCSYPDKNFTIDLAHALSQNGVDVLELGVPFSDPVADGATIEKANLLSLKNGFKFDDIYDISSKISPHVKTLWMGYFNPFYQKGLQNVVNEAKKCGVSGFILPDLPYEESKVYKPLVEQNDLSLIDFIAPTHSKERIKTIVEGSKEFIYLVAYAGITGSAKSEDLKDVISHIKEFSKTPVYIGFGVDETNAKQKVQGVDGVIVGSAFVKTLLDTNLTSSEKIAKITALSRVIKEQINS